VPSTSTPASTGKPLRSASQFIPAAEFIEEHAFRRPSDEIGRLIERVNSYVVQLLKGTVGLECLPSSRERA
jgi:hypothetical protein